ncbi:hypothetical protein U1Q18_035844 [Sarracenia purpurea var. burkii]
MQKGVDEVEAVDKSENIEKAASDEVDGIDATKEDDTDCEKGESEDFEDSEDLNLAVPFQNSVKVNCPVSEPCGPNFVLLSVANDLVHCDLKLEHESEIGRIRMRDNGVRQSNAHQVLDEKPDPQMATVRPAHQVFGVLSEPNPVADSVFKFHEEYHFFGSNLSPPVLWDQLNLAEIKYLLEHFKWQGGFRAVTLKLRLWFGNDEKVACKKISDKMGLVGSQLINALVCCCGTRGLLVKLVVLPWLHGCRYATATNACYGCNGVACCCIPICCSALLLFNHVLLLNIDTVQPSLCCYVPMPDVLLCSYACRAAQPMAAILMCCYDPIPTVLPMPVMLNPCLLNCSTQAFSSCSLLCSYVC